MNNSTNTQVLASKGTDTQAPAAPVTLASLLSELSLPHWLTVRALQVIPAASALNRLHEALTLLSLWAQEHPLMLEPREHKVVTSRSKYIYQKSDKSDLGPLLRAYGLLADADLEDQLYDASNAAGLRRDTYKGAARLRATLVGICRKIKELKFNDKNPDFRNPQYFDNLTAALVPSMAAHLVVKVGEQWRMLLSGMSAHIANECRYMWHTKEETLLLAIHQRGIKGDRVNLITAAAPVPVEKMQEWFPNEVTTRLLNYRYDVASQQVLCDQLVQFDDIELQDITIVPDQTSQDSCQAIGLAIAVYGQSVAGAEPVTQLLTGVKTMLERSGEPPLTDDIKQHRARVIASQLQQAWSYEEMLGTVEHALQIPDLSEKLAACKRDYPDSITVGDTTVPVTYERVGNLLGVTLQVGDNDKVLALIQDHHLPVAWKKCSVLVQVNHLDVPGDDKLKNLGLIPLTNGCSMLRACLKARQDVAPLEVVLDNPDYPLVTEHTVWDPPAQPDSNLPVGTTVWLVAGDQDPYFVKGDAINRAHKLLKEKVLPNIITAQLLPKPQIKEVQNQTTGNAAAQTEATATTDQPQGETKTDSNVEATPKQQPLHWVHPKLKSMLIDAVLDALPGADLSVRKAESTLCELLESGSDFLNKCQERLDKELPPLRDALAGYQGAHDNHDRQRLARRAAEREHKAGNTLAAINHLEEALDLTAYVQRTEKKINNQKKGSKMSKEEHDKRHQSKKEEKSAEAQKGKGKNKDGKNKGGKNKGK